ncbi:MAG: sulfatase-like hydrolase/transferase [Flavobacteriaceae bacterium]|nr:sulfatase-like hydrolase/transferase [Flavobacteriaceae bacterium]
MQHISILLLSICFLYISVFSITAMPETTQVTSPERPNILLLFADDLGYEALGCYGGQDYSTPNLNRLATEGLRFTRAYTSPICTPSRMSLYTGTYVSRHQYYDVIPVHKGTKEAVDFRNRWTTFAQVLRQSGYTTSVTGKWQMATLEVHPQHCRDAGFDSWCVWQIWREGAKTTRYWDPCLNQDGNIRNDVTERFGPDVLADYVITQMKKAIEEEKPFFIQHNMMLPHWPITPMPAEKEAGKLGSLNSMISYMDGIVGRIVDAVDELGIAENTWVIFMGDNGTEAFGEPRHTRDGIVKGGKRDLTDAGTHIPMIVRRPGTIQPGTTADDLIDMADWFPTFCNLANVDLPKNLSLDGISFASRLLENKPFPRQWVTGGYLNKLSIFDGQIRVTTGDSITKENATLHHVLRSLLKSD